MATTSSYAYPGMFIVTVSKADGSVAFQTDCYGYNNVRMLRKQYLAQGYSRVKHVVNKDSRFQFNRGKCCHDRYSFLQ